MSNVLAPAVGPGNTKGVTILGREPAAWAGTIEAALATALLLGWLAPLGIDNAKEGALVMAFVSAVLGLYVAYATEHIAVGVVVGLVKAMIAVATVWGLHMGEDVSSSVLILTSIVFAFFNRQVTNPLADKT